MANKLAKKAAEAVTAEKGFERTSGYCQRFARQCVQAVHGHKYDDFFKASAYETMLAFKNSPYVVDKEQTLPGDILYKGRKTSGKYGHVGIRVVGNKVAENSSSHINEAGDRDARGFRTLNAYGDFELAVRLPESSESK